MRCKSQEGVSPSDFKVGRKGKPTHLDVGVDHELSSSQGTDHHETGTETGEQSSGAEGAGHADQAGGDSLSGRSGRLVDLGEEGVGRLGDLASVTRQ